MPSKGLPNPAVPVTNSEVTRQLSRELIAAVLICSVAGGVFGARYMRDAARASRVIGKAYAESRPTKKP